MKQLRILVVDDDQRIINFLSTKLKVLGYDVLTASNGLEALEQAKAQEPDLIILDVVMPKMDGLTTLKELRSFSSVPVIVLSAKGTDIDKIKGLDLGADDYLQKPFNPNELISRIEAVKRRLDPALKRREPDSISVGDLIIDFEGRRLIIKDSEEHLTRIEWLLLSELVRNAGRLMTYEEILTRVWGPEYRDDVQTLRTWISRLRHKLAQTPDGIELIRTIPKTGYIMDLPPA